MSTHDFRLDDSIFLNSAKPSKRLRLLGTRKEKNTFFGVSYTTTDSQLRQFADGKRTKEDVLSHCEALSKPLNAKCNRETSKLGLDYLEHVTTSNVFRLKPALFGLRSDILLKCQFPFGYVDGGKIIFFMPHYRSQSWKLSREDLFIQASVISMVFGQDDYEGAEIEVADMSNKVDGARILDIRRYSADELISEAMIYQKFQNFVDIWDLYNAEARSTTASSHLVLRE